MNAHPDCRIPELEPAMRRLLECERLGDEGVRLLNRRSRVPRDQYWRADAEAGVICTKFAALVNRGDLAPFRTVVERPRKET